MADYRIAHDVAIFIFNGAKINSEFLYFYIFILTGLKLVGGVFDGIANIAQWSSKEFKYSTVSGKHRVMQPSCLHLRALLRVVSTL